MTPFSSALRAPDLPPDPVLAAARLAPVSVKPAGPPAPPPAPRLISAEVAAPESFSGLPFSIPRLVIGVKPALPLSGWVPGEYYCRRGQMNTRRAVLSAWPIDVALPPFTLQAVADRREKAPLVRNNPATPRPVEIFSVREKPLRSWYPLARGPAAAIAASVLVGIGLWLSGVGRVGTRSLDASAAPGIVEDTARSGSAGVSGGVRPVSGPLARVKQAMAKRAAVELTDSFAGGMAAWGGEPRGGVSGWSRQPGGYVRPGHLALFRPSLDFTDYHMEFLGQIESKGMSWVMRAHDDRNYVAMKFHVVEPGAWPVVTMVHYPVREGRTGAKVETILAVRVANNTAYHIEVAVKGNQFVVSLEGEKVDSWTDEAPSSGGVGFFSEATERARLYWVRVYKNDDWLGRLCGFIAGSGAGESSESAWLVRAPLSAPAPWPLPLPVQVAICNKQPGEYPWRGPARARLLPDKRGSAWVS